MCVILTTMVPVEAAVIPVTTPRQPLGQTHAPVPVSICCWLADTVARVDHAQPVGMRLLAYFAKLLHSMLSWTHVHV